MSDEIDIPASAWEIKAIFPTRPGDDIIAEIKAYVKAYGTPYLWRGHTHAPPPKDGPVVYLDPRQSCRCLAPQLGARSRPGCTSRRCDQPVLHSAAH